MKYGHRICSQKYNQILYKSNTYNLQIFYKSFCFNKLYCNVFWNYFSVQKFGSPIKDQENVYDREKNKINYTLIYLLL